MEVDGEVAHRTMFGWVLSGPAKLRDDKQPGELVNVQRVAADIQVLWELDQPPADVKIFPAFPLRKTGRTYEAGLLWRDEKRPHDNKAQAIAAVKSLADKLERLGQRQEYEDIIMKEYSELDAIELEPEPSKEGYYMPHHAVKREQAVTTKLRVAFNGSAAKKGALSLNDVVDPGPSLVPSLPGLLVRFREYRYALQAD